MKEFFSIEKPFSFQISDLTAAITVANVALIIMGFWWAPFFGLVNCGIFFVLNIINHSYINAYVTQIALVVLNIYFMLDKIMMLF